MPARPQGSTRPSWLHDMRVPFTIDLRSLAAFRIALAILILIDLAQRAEYLVAHYTDHGALPRAALRANPLSQIGPPGLSPHWLFGDPWWEAALFCLAALVGCCLLTGYRTWLATAVSWVLLVSLHARNPLVLNGGDLLLRVLLFWSLFLPLGAVASVDALKRRHPPVRLTIVNFATAALLIQVAVMYWFGSLHKRHVFWSADYSAAYYALNVEYITRPLGRWLLQFPALLRLLTASTFWLELVGPILVFCPLGNRYLRIALPCLFVLFHLGLALTLKIGLFSQIAMAAWLPFLPSMFWNRVSAALAGSRARGGPFKRIAARLRRDQRPADPADAPPGIALGRLGNALAALLLVYMMAWNVRTLDYDRWEAWLLPRRLNFVGSWTGLSQGWKMFAPRPPLSDGWYVMRGELANGEVVNLWKPAAPLPHAPPSSGPNQYEHWRWRKYLTGLASSRRRPYRPWFAHWLARRWNQTQAGGQRDRRVRAVRLLYVIRPTPPPGKPPAPLRTIELYSAPFPEEPGSESRNRR